MTTEDRIARLEARCRKLSFALLCVSTVGAAAILMAAKQAEQAAEIKASRIEVSRIEVVDPSGAARIVLGDLERGVFGMFMQSANGEKRVIIHDEGGASLKTENGSIALITSSTGASLHLNSAGHRPRAMLYSRDDHAGLQLRDTKGEINQILETRRIKLPADRMAQDPFGN